MKIFSWAWNEIFNLDLKKKECNLVIFDKIAFNIQWQYFYTEITVCTEQELSQIDMIYLFYAELSFFYTITISR